mmetsp:Transcript_59289/g.139669  ORF Transcript_59289/g.139669 Transcript_59289/m.139669 type:complete len:241 (+) Transcript_59289:604-1326(+)
MSATPSGIGTILPIGSTISFLIPIMIRSLTRMSRPGTCITSRPMGTIERSRFGISVIEIQTTRAKGNLSWRWMRKMSSVSMLMFSTLIGMEVPPTSTTANSTPASSSETKRTVAVTHISSLDRISLTRPRMTQGEAFLSVTFLHCTSLMGPAGSTLSRRRPCRMASSKTNSRRASPIRSGYRSHRFLTSPLSHSVVSLVFRSGFPFSRPARSLSSGGGFPSRQSLGLRIAAMARKPSKLP